MPDKNIDMENMKLEEAMRRLSEAVGLLEAESADLEESLRLYEEGIRLVRICKDRLSDAERRVKLLSLSPDGELTETDMEQGERV